MAEAHDRRGAFALVVAGQHQPDAVTRGEPARVDHQWDTVLDDLVEWDGLEGPAR